MIKKKLFTESEVDIEALKRTIDGLDLQQLRTLADYVRQKMDEMTRKGQISGGYRKYIEAYLLLLFKSKSKYQPLLGKAVYDREVDKVYATPARKFKEGQVKLADEGDATMYSWFMYNLSSPAGEAFELWGPGLDLELYLLPKPVQGVTPELLKKLKNEGKRYKINVNTRVFLALDVINGENAIVVIKGLNNFKNYLASKLSQLSRDSYDIVKLK